MMPATSSNSRSGEYQTSTAEKASGRDGLLDQPAHLLDHRQPVGGLHARAFQAIVEDRILVDGHVESGGFAHDLDADVMGIAIGQQVVEVIHGARQNAGQHRQRHLAADQPPESWGSG